ncbi:hypothetical protein NUW58_g2552 [Xylaria curta]|uniref:Uncharacterized protein n=1 Tax=Xylaria curta TaxID=42375 RepID=A0ACC1PFY6_9PEZI|nr:hypothetical protein NUW58_g2552 [Xylaria curta]
MSENTSPSPSRPTFGVEVELLVATIPERASDPQHGEGLPPVLRIPDTEFEIGEENKYTQQRVEAVLNEYLSPAWQSTFTPIFGQSQTISHTVLDTYKTWLVDTDESVMPPPGTNLYKFIPIEMCSPVQYASPKGFEVINLALSIITSKFRCIVNPSCGLHVHVGLGVERMSLDNIRRMGSLAYAVEPLLFTLHDPLRRVNYNCMSLRDYSPVSTKVQSSQVIPHYEQELLSTATYCHRYLGLDRRYGEPPLSAREDSATEEDIDAFLKTRQPGHFEPFTHPGRSEGTIGLPGDLSLALDYHISTVNPSSATPPATNSPRRRKMPRLQLPRHTAKDDIELVTKLEGWGAALDDGSIILQHSRGSPTNVFEATRQLYAQPASCNIAKELLLTPRPAISFANYSCHNLVPRKTTPRTIEFRLGAGSLDGEWVSTWAKIVAGIFKFALYATPIQFMDLLENCDRAINEVGTYDVVDLLDEIGLFAEAEIVERRLTSMKGDWKLKFMEPDS